MSVIVLDDRDKAIKYVGQWMRGGNANTEYEATSTQLTGPVSDASAILTFFGTGIAVLGSIHAEDLQSSSYSLDGQAATNFTSTQETIARYSQRFFSVDNLSNENHTLVMKPIKGTLLLDLITVQTAVDYTAAAPATNTTCSSIASSNTVASTAKSNSTTEAATANCPSEAFTTEKPTAAVTSTPLALPSVQQQSHCGYQKAPNEIWEIVGGVYVGLTVICLLIFTIYYWRRNRDAKLKAVMTSKPRTSVTPYDFISQSGTAEVDLAGSESSYETTRSGTADYGDTVVENQNRVNGATRRSGKVPPNRGSMGTGHGAVNRRGSTGASTSPPMYQSEFLVR